MGLTHTSMTADQWKRIASLYDAAHARPPAERARFLADVCPDDALVRDQVQALLEHNSDADEAACPPGLSPPPATSLIGRVVGEYRFDRRLGAGGMGEVYQARDLKLGRDVAIKVLPDDRQDSHDHHARFEREARVLAALNHPHIGAIYGTLEEGSLFGLILELATGPTLASILEARRSAFAGAPSFSHNSPGLPVGVSLTIARQIALALEAAHDKGIIHRDLKPSNIVIHGDFEMQSDRTGPGDLAGAPGFTVKVLDFGLAKLMAPSVTSGDPTRLSVGSTRPGVLMGTPAYMSPEQARGQPIDRRGDVWAFGCVLFEMLSGRPAFAGRTVPDTLVAVLDREVDLGALPASTPAGVRRLIRRCLEKDASRRLRDMGDARLEIEEHATTRAHQRRQAARPGTTIGSRTPALWAALAATGGLAVMGTLADWSWLWGTPATGEASMRTERFLTSANAEFGSRISPDGQWVSFLSDNGAGPELHVKPRDGAAATRVLLPSGRPLTQLWSPDGRQLAYVLRQAGDTLLQVVAAFGAGTPVLSVPIRPSPTQATLLRWIGNTVYLQMTLAGAGPMLHRVDLQSRVLSSVSDGWALKGTPRRFDVSSDGARVVFAMEWNGSEDLWTVNIDGTGLRQLTNDASFERLPMWIGGDHSVLFQSNRSGQIDLWEMDLGSLILRPLTSSDAAEEPESTSSDGSVVSFLQRAEDADLWMWNPGAGPATRLTDDALTDFAPTFARASSQLVFQRRRASPLQADATDSSLMIGSLQNGRSTATPLSDGFAPELSPDGTKLAYMTRSAQQHRARLTIRNLQTHQTLSLSTTSPRSSYSLNPPEWAHQNVGWAPDSTELYFVDWPDQWTIRRYRVGDAGAGPPLITAADGEQIHDLHVSPDGRTLAYVVSAGGRKSTLHLLDLPSGVSHVAGAFARYTYARGWLPDGALVVVHASTFHDDYSADTDVWAVNPGTAPRRIADVSRALIATSRIDPVTSTLYVARIENGIHNVYSVSLPTGRTRQVSDNIDPGVTFSGLEPGPARSLIGVRAERREDIVLISRRPAADEGRRTAPR